MKPKKAATPKKQRSSASSSNRSPRRSPAAAKRATTQSRGARGGLKIKKILIPTDFSDPSRNALKQALAMAQAFGAKLIPLHVVEPIIYPVETGFVSMTAETVTPQAVKAMKQKLQSWVARHVPASYLARPEVRVGRPYDEIVSAAAEYKADLIVVSTHGYTGIKHVLLGSTAERVVRHSPCPVLTVRRKE